MNVREFLHGGRGMPGVTVVLNGGTVEGIWIKGGDRVRLDLPERES